jgi:hypothetical protein
MVTAADFCLLISNSGETSDLRDIVGPYAPFWHSHGCDFVKVEQHADAGGRLQTDP